MASLTDELAHVEAEIQRLEAVRDYLRTRTNGAKPATRRRGPRMTGTVTIADAAEKALKKAGGPMKTAALLDKVRAGGAACGSAETLYKTLTRNPRFVKTGRGEWGLAD